MGKDEFTEELLRLIDRCETEECLKDGIGFTVVWICHLSCWHHPKIEDVIGPTIGFSPHSPAQTVLEFVRNHYKRAFGYQDVLHQVCQHILAHGYVELAMRISALVKSKSWLPPYAQR